MLSKIVPKISSKSCSDNFCTKLVKRFILCNEEVNVTVAQNMERMGELENPLIGIFMEHTFVWASQ